jgi:hypothetical protein
MENLRRVVILFWIVAYLILVFGFSALPFAYMSGYWVLSSGLLALVIWLLWQFGMRHIAQATKSPTLIKGARAAAEFWLALNGANVLRFVIDHFFGATGAELVRWGLLVVLIVLIWRGFHQKALVEDETPWHENH